MVDGVEERPQVHNVLQHQHSENGIGASIASESPNTDETQIEYKEDENELNNSLRAIGEETTKLAEYIQQERNLTQDLSNLLVHVLRRLKTSFNIPPSDLTVVGPAKKIELTAEGYLRITRRDDSVNSRFLAEHSPDTVLSVMITVVPELEKAVESYRENITRRVTLLEKIKSELKSLQKAVSYGEKEKLKQTESNGVQSSSISNKVKDQTDKGSESWEM
ncbi:MAG: hypothetical protein JSV64_08910 [Candidatus Bathyarchaeota archaeon]|nr:MAG: hypothetical protein JSV64_08910 [Candidatus Bathyarchaeota archaeon]